MSFIESYFSRKNTYLNKLSKIKKVDGCAAIEAQANYGKPCTPPTFLNHQSLPEIERLIAESIEYDSKIKNCLFFIGEMAKGLR